MKTFTPVKFAFVFLALVWSFISHAGDNVTFTLVKPPCNNDGILVAHMHTNGVLPTVVEWRYSCKWSDTSAIVKHTVYTKNDTLFNYCGDIVYFGGSLGPVGIGATYWGAPPIKYKEPVGYLQTTCPNKAEVGIEILSGTPPYKVEWFNSQVNIGPTGPAVAVGNPASLPSGFYDIKVTDSFGCVQGSYGTTGAINVPVTVSGGSTIKFDLSTVLANCFSGNATVKNISGGVPPYSISWSNNSTNDSIGNLITGTYYWIKVTDSIGCVTSQYFTIASSRITINSTVTKAGCTLDDGRIMVTASGGFPPYNYSWDNGAQTPGITGLSPGYYKIVVTDGGQCKDSISINVGVNTPVRANSTVTTTLCDSATGTSTLNITAGTPPFTVKWETNPVQTGLKAEGLPKDYTYFVVTDSTGCKLRGYTFIQASNSITVTPAVIATDCDSAKGSLSLAPSQGYAPYKIHWADVSDTAFVRTGLAEGYYKYTITDSKGCEGKSQVSVPSKKVEVLTASCWSDTGSASITVKTGEPPFKYFWNSGDTTPLATNLNYTSYQCVVVDNAGCTYSGLVYINKTNSAYAVSFSVTNEKCLNGANGSVTATASGAVVPYTYKWSNGSTGATINNLIKGTYTVTVIDGGGCVKISSVNIGQDSLKISLQPTKAKCKDGTNASIKAKISGGTAPYTYNWSNSDTGEIISNISSGFYKVTVMDVMGCSGVSSTNVGIDTSGTECYCIAKGRLYIDTNNNCQYDAGEQPVYNAEIYSHGGGFSYTQKDGTYFIQLVKGNYMLSPKSTAYYQLAPCQADNIPVNVTSVGNCEIINDFAITANQVHDLWVSSSIKGTPPRPGFDYSRQLVVKNKSALPEANIQVSQKHDNRLDLTEAIPSVFTQPDAVNQPGWYVITSGFPVLAPFSNDEVTIKYNVPSNIPIGTVLTFYDTVSYSSPIESWVSDYTPSDNITKYEVIVVGSYDPNFKEVSPIGAGDLGYILNEDSVLSYTLHFQNTGNYLAEKLVVIDTLDKDLDITSFSPGYATHNYTAEMSESGIVKFTFDNINLPDSTSDEEGSMGLVMYTVHQKPGLTGGTQFSSPASIYFDFNLPIQTNATINTIAIATGLGQVSQTPFDLSIYPNPANNMVNLVVNAREAGAATLRLYNMLGKAVQQQTLTLAAGKSSTQVNAGQLPAGVYFVELSNSQYSTTQKLTVIE